LVVITGLQILQYLVQIAGVKILIQNRTNPKAKVRTEKTGEVVIITVNNPLQKRYSKKYKGIPPQVHQAIKK
jgi:hypothetical protein